MLPSHVVLELPFGLEGDGRAEEAAKLDVRVQVQFDVLQQLVTCCKSLPAASQEALPVLRMAGFEVLGKLAVSLERDVAQMTFHVHKLADLLVVGVPKLFATFQFRLVHSRRLRKSQNFHSCFLVVALLLLHFQSDLTGQEILISVIVVQKLLLSSLMSLRLTGSRFLNLLANLRRRSSFRLYFDLSDSIQSLIYDVFIEHHDVLELQLFFQVYHRQSLKRFSHIDEVQNFAFKTFAFYDRNIVYAVAGFNYAL